VGEAGKMKPHWNSKNIEQFFVVIAIVTLACLTMFAIYKIESGYAFFFLLDLYIVVLLFINHMRSGSVLSSLNPNFFFLVGAVLFIGIPPFIIDLPEIESPKVLLAIVATAIGLTAFTIGWYTTKSQKINQYGRVLGDIVLQVRRRERRLLLTILLSFFMFGLVLQDYALRQVGGNLWLRFLQMRNVSFDSNIWETFYRIPYAFSFGVINGAALVLLVVAFINESRDRVLKSVAVITYVIAVSVDFGTGTRMQVVTLLGAALLLFVCNAKKERRLLPVFQILLVGIVFLFLVGFQTAYRDKGLIDLQALPVQMADIFNGYSIVTYGLNQIPSLLDVFEAYPDRRDYLYGSTFLAVLVNPIPREFYPNKPVGIGAIMGDVDLVTRRGTSISVTIFGELYANGGIFAIVVGLLGAGLLLGKWYSIFVQNSNNVRYFILYVHSLPFIILQVRGGFLEVTMMYMVQLVVLLFVLKMVGFYLIPNRVTGMRSVA
jgi:oligosaccharide repeat unit polymerase